MLQCIFGMVNEPSMNVYEINICIIFALIIQKDSKAWFRKKLHDLT